MASRRFFLSGLSASLAAVLLGGTLTASANGMINGNSTSGKGDLSDATNSTVGRNVLVTVRRDDDGKNIGNFFLDDSDNYKAFPILTPKLGQVFIRVAPIATDEEMVEVTVIQNDGKVLSHSFSGVDTTLQFHRLGVTLVLGFAPEGLTKEAFTSVR